ncbi:pilus assembly protein [Salmonella enterica]|nr:pilus assembly protein [Salmonella enterica]EBS3177229.1 pilus assembly protein [Salmonella enterica subsp. enterica serovar Newport]EEE9161446.1 tyrosine-type recombinase/integrase [Salmonella enterica subsp. enterica serovar Kimberley]EEO0342969.1 tyrosine-type recombinase/integrase [Salmonella enterica]EJI7102791.1 tyrosine-type recombinase/integrase [Salmonella enterica]
MQKRKFLTPQEVSLLLTTVLDGPNPERNHCLIMMAFLHGLRATELLHLRLSDIDLHGRQINVRRIKNSFSTVHPLIPREVRALREWLRVRKQQAEPGNDWLFIKRSGDPISRQQLYNILTDASKKTGLPVCAHPHMLRHACGYALADNGADTRLIQDYLGHRNIRHTVRYTASNAARFGGIWRGRNGKKGQQNDPKCKPRQNVTGILSDYFPVFVRRILIN